MMRYIKIETDAWEDLGATYRVKDYRTNSVSSIGEYTLVTEDGREFTRGMSDDQVHWMEAKDW